MKLLYINHATPTKLPLAAASLPLLCSQELWQSRAPPKPLELSQLVPDLSALTDKLKGSSSSSSGSSAAKLLGLKDQATWSAEDNAQVFLMAIVMFLEHRGSEVRTGGPGRGGGRGGKVRREKGRSWVGWGDQATWSAGDSA